METKNYATLISQAFEKTETRKRVLKYLKSRERSVRAPGFRFDVDKMRRAITTRVFTPDMRDIESLLKELSRINVPVVGGAIRPVGRPLIQRGKLKGNYFEMYVNMEDFVATAKSGEETLMRFVNPNYRTTDAIVSREEPVSTPAPRKPAQEAASDNGHLPRKHDASKVPVTIAGQTVLLTVQQLAEYERARTA